MKFHLSEVYKSKLILRNIILAYLLLSSIILSLFSVVVVLKFGEIYRKDIAENAKSVVQAN